MTPREPVARRMAPGRVLRWARGGWVPVVGTAAVVTAAFLLPYAVSEVGPDGLRREYGLTFVGVQRSGVTEESRTRLPDVWAWAAVGAGVAIASGLATRRDAGRHLGGFLAAMGLLVALRLGADAGPILRSTPTEAGPGLFIGAAGDLALVLGGLLVLRAAPPRSSQPRRPSAAVAFAVAGAAAFLLSTALPVRTFTGGPLLAEPGFPFVRIDEGLAAWSLWLWPALFVLGVAALAVLGAWAAGRGDAAGAGVGLAAAWVALTFAVATLSHTAPAAQRSTVAAYVGMAGGAALLAAALLAAGGGPLPRRGSLSSGRPPTGRPGDGQPWPR